MPEKINPDPEERPSGFGTTPITSEALHDWIANGHGRKDPHYHVDGEQGQVDESDDETNEVETPEERAERERVERLEAEIDDHLSDLRAEADKVEDSDWNRKTVDAFIRTAYGKGYIDRGNDPSARFLTRHGYRQRK
ncbi:MAG: hypothetical protein AAB896_00195 [Patescibacteria group bacterium]